MLTATKVAFCFCIVIGVFEEIESWTIDLPQVRKYFFENSFNDRPRYGQNLRDKVVYDNIHTHSLHTDYDKYREHEHYADEYKYHGYMEQKVHDAVRNGSAYLEGLRRAIEAYTRRLEDCRRLNVSANIIQFRPNYSTTNLTNPSTGNLTSPSLSMANLTDFNLPTNFSANVNVPANFTYVSQLSMNFTNFMAMSTNYTLFNVDDEFRDCMRADLASEHVRRLAQLAVWAASELQDKLYADEYSKHEHEHEQDDTLVLRLAWFLDRLAHLTGYNPRPGDFVQETASPPTTTTALPPSTPLPLSLMPTLISNSDLQLLTSCMGGNSSAAPDRCALTPGSAPNPGSYMSRGWPAPSTYPPDLRPSASENQEYTYSEQVYTDDDMPLSLPERPRTKRSQQTSLLQRLRSKRSVKHASLPEKKAKRSVQADPLQNVVQYYAKYKVWTGSNGEEHGKDSEPPNPANQEEFSNRIRTKRFIVKKFKHFKKPEKPMPDLSSIIKHKLGIHVKKDEKEAKSLKKFLDKLHKPKTEVRVLKFKKSKRSIMYSKKVQPRIPLNPQGDISYYIKNKPGRNYNYNAAQAALVRAGLEQVFQTGNILVVQRYGSNYVPTNTMQISQGYLEGYSDV